MILTNETDDKYISNFTKREMKSKYCISYDDEEDENSENYINYSNQYLIDECKINYCKNILNFTNEEKILIDTLLQKLCSELKLIYPKFPYQVWRLIKGNDKLEAGLPHTRKDCIILPQSYVNKYMKYNESDEKKKNKIFVDFADLLIHEQFHILQRQEPKMFNDLYTYD